MVNDYRQGNPYCVQIELTEGCNLRCTFCGLNGIRGSRSDPEYKNLYKFMTVETAQAIAQGMADAGWNSRIEFAMHGEPTLNPEAPAIIKVFREALPKAYMMMESNGGGIAGKYSADKILTLFDAGLNCLAFDQYNDVMLVPKIKAQLAKMCGLSDLTGITKIGGVPIYDYPSCGAEGNPHQRKTGRRLVFVAPIDTSTKGTHATVNNHAGCGSPPNDKAEGKRCAKPFREISFRWDGSVAICCNDWRGQYVVGNVASKTPDELWHDPRFYSARNKLYHGQRDFGPCNGCDATSYRPGLLPDSKGLSDLPLPSVEDLETIEDALAEGPLTKPVKRPWEL